VSDLVRFGVAMDRDLLRRFDERIARRGYENRSEALRDLVRADLTRAAWEGDAHVAATLTLVVARRQREHVARALEERADGAVVVSSMHVPLDGDRGMEVVALRGRASALSALAGRVGGARGVLAAELSIAAVDGP
jgi:CopG family nickel-responsive transcriptional regulator